MEVNKYNYFIKDFDEIRSILKNICIFGCYGKEQLISMEHISDSKYDKDIRRIKYFINNSNRMENRIQRKKVLGLKYDRYDNIGNFLIKSYKIKTFSPQDINLYFFILQILSREQKELSINEIILIIQDEVLNESNDDGISYRMLRDKLEEMEIMGFVKSNQSSPVKYKLEENILQKFTLEEMNQLHQLLYFYRNVTPISVPAYFSQETIKNHLLYFQGDDCSSKDIFLFKHIFLQNILNDEIIYIILNAQNNHNKIQFIYNDKTEKKIIAIPLKIILDCHFGRQYIFCYDVDLGKPQTYKINRISKVSALDDKFIPCDYEKYFELVNKSWSMTQINELDNPMEETVILVEIDFYIDDNKEYILKQLMSEKRQGIAKKVSENHWLFSIQVISPLEMIPWIRSFGEYAKVRRSEKHDLADRIEADWKEVLIEYGVI